MVNDFINDFIKLKKVICLGKDEESKPEEIKFICTYQELLDFFLMWITQDMMIFQENKLNVDKQINKLTEIMNTLICFEVLLEHFNDGKIKVDKIEKLMEEKNSKYLNDVFYSCEMVQKNLKKYGCSNNKTGNISKWLFVGVYKDLIDRLLNKWVIEGNYLEDY